jgi:phosphoenolpyruvate carboxykinase (GTP)
MSIGLEYENDKFLWPGFGDNIRVIDWMCRRVKGDDVAEMSPLGFVPKKGSINCDGLNLNWEKLFELPRAYLLEDVEETTKFLKAETGTDLPPVIEEELNKQKERIAALKA